MIPIIVNPKNENPANLQILDAKNCIVTKIRSQALRSSAGSAQASGYTYGKMATIGSSNVNSFLTALDSSEYIVSQTYGPTNIYLTTYNGNTPQMRCLFPINARDGVSLSRVVLEGITLLYTGSVVTGTLNVRLCKMDSSGTVTTIATGTQLIDSTSNGLIVSVIGTNTPVSFTNTDWIVVELEIAQTSGTHNTANYTAIQITSGSSSGIIYIS